MLEDVERQFIQTWRDCYGDGYATVRDAINLGLDGNGDMLSAIHKLIPEMASQARPKLLSRWLFRNENRPISINGRMFRLAVDRGHSGGNARWRVVELSREAARAIVTGDNACAL